MDVSVWLCACMGVRISVYVGVPVCAICAHVRCAGVRKEVHMLISLGVRAVREWVCASGFARAVLRVWSCVCGMSACGCKRVVVSVWECAWACTQVGLRM